MDGDIYHGFLQEKRALGWIYRSVRLRDGCLFLGKKKLNALSVHAERNENCSMLIVSTGDEREYVFRCSSPEILESWLSRLAFPVAIAPCLWRPLMYPYARLLLLAVRSPESCFFALRGGLSKALLPKIFTFLREKDAEPNMRFIMEERIEKQLLEIPGIGHLWKNFIRSCDRTRKSLHFATKVEGAHGVLPIYPFKAFLERHKIGGTVYKVERLATRFTCAAKFGSSVELLREAFFLKRLSHPLFQTFLNLYVDDQGRRFVMTTQYEGNLGSLSWILQNTVFAMNEVAYIGHELFCGIAYMHSQRVIHRSINGHNVCLTVDGLVKLFDFEFATEFPSQNQRLYGAGRCPEMLFGKPHDRKSDIFCAGWVLYTCINRRFLESNAVWQVKCILGILEIEYPFSSLLECDPDKRPDAEGAQKMFVQVERADKASCGCKWKEILCRPIGE